MGLQFAGPFVISSGTLDCLVKSHADCFYVGGTVGQFLDYCSMRFAIAVVNF